MNVRRLPLGIDIGTTRIRLAQLQRLASGACRVAAVASRDLPDGVVSTEGVLEPELLAAVVEDLRTEIGTSQRRCVIALPASVATLRLVRFPKMSRSERQRAARFEAERFLTPNDSSVSVIRVHPVNPEEGLHAVGIARQDALNARVACVKRAGLVPVAVDHDACAMRRAFPAVDAVLDVGHRQATLHAFTPGAPLSLDIPGGSAEITRSIGADLTIDVIAAEKRKRILGTAGAGEAARDEFAVRVGAAVAKARERVPIRHVALTGNGARLAGLPAAIESAAQVMAEMSASDILRDGAYPDDVIRAAAPDWTMAVALAGWSTAR